MKKILIAAAITCAAALSQAATVNWNSDAIYKPIDANGKYGTESSDKVKTAVTGYLWEVTDLKGDGGEVIKTAAQIWTEYNAAPSKIYEEFAKTGHGALGTETKQVTSNNATSKANLAGTTDWGVGDTAYAIILYTYNDGSKDWYVANTAKVDDMGNSTAAVAKLNLFEGGSIDSKAQGAAITGWTAASGAVPEPTSAMLMLLGVAGLMLKRKRA